MINRKTKRAFDKVGSPYLNGSKISKPTSPEEALAMIEGHGKQIERQQRIIYQLQTEEIDLYDRSCVLFMKREYSALEDVKKAYAENQAKRLQAVDMIAVCNETIRVCKAYLQEHPIKADDKGEISIPRYMQGRLF